MAKPTGPGIVGRGPLILGKVSSALAADRPPRAADRAALAGFRRWPVIARGPGISGQKPRKSAEKSKSAQRGRGGRRRRQGPSFSQTIM